MFGIYIKSAAGTFSPSVTASENRTKKRASSNHRYCPFNCIINLLINNLKLSVTVFSALKKSILDLHNEYEYHNNAGLDQTEINELGNEYSNL